MAGAFSEGKRMSAQTTSFVSRPRFDEYREQFANFFKMERPP
jgi:hypothetical protein